MPNDSPSKVQPPRPETTQQLARDVDELRHAASAIAHATPETMGEALAGLTRAVVPVREDLERLRPWIQAFTGSSFLLDSAQKQLMDLAELAALQSPAGGSLGAGIPALLTSPAQTALGSVERLQQLLPDHLEVAQARRRKDQSFLYRVRTLPPDLRRRVWTRVVLGTLMLLTSIGGIAILLDPSLADAVGLGRTISNYTASSVVVVAVVLFAGMRTVWASSWLAASAKIASDYDDRLETRALAGLQKHEHDALNPRPPDDSRGRR